MNLLSKSFPMLATSLFAVGCTQVDKQDPLALKKLSGDSKPMNIVFILSDDHRYDYMGFMNTVPWLETPHMDRMVREGAHIRNAFVTTSLSSPSRASILTGMYSHTHQVVDNTAPLPEGLVFFPQYLQKAGYQTAFFGKWHMGNDSGDPQPGFHHWEGFKGQGEYYNPRINTNGEWIEYKDSTYVTDLLTEHALAFMKKQKEAGNPFMVYLSHKGVHDNFSAAKRHAGCYQNEELVLPPSFNTPTYEIKTAPTKNPQTGEVASHEEFYGKDMLPDWVKNQRESWHGVDYSYHGRSWEVQVRKYCETLRSVDESIGSVLDYLKEAGLDENTIVIYMGDNGFAWGEHGLIDKRQFYEESVKVPMLVRCPSVFKGGQSLDQMVQNVDVAPTLLACAGLEKPEHMVGASFLPLLRGENVAWRDRIFYEYYWEFDFPQTPTMHGVRTDDFKYIRYHGIWDTNEFYDLKKDPYEMHNEIKNPEYQDIIKQLNHDIYNWLETTGGMNIPLKRTERVHQDHRNLGNY